MEELRAGIDAIDDKLLELIKERVGLAREVGSRKHENGESVFYVPSREAEIIRRLTGQNEDVLPEIALHGIFREIIGACLSLEQPLTIAYLGPVGTFTHAAARHQFGSLPTYTPCRNFDEVFDEVESGRATYGVVPVENAFEGAVTHTLDLFVESQASICAEVMFGIHHHLLGSGSIDEIEVVYSKMEVFGQCRKWLQSHLPNVRLVEAASTAAAAEQVAGNPKAAAIASKETAERCDLPVLAANIEDFHGNTTRFLVIGQHDSPPSGKDKTALVMSTKDRPGALHDLLAPFHKRGIGLTRIESRPSKKRLWEYVFFLDLLGHREEPDVAAALEDVRALPDSFVKVLGSFPVASRT
ncbi:MAG TPA: prephenate dehydratase [Mariprofundaceae bacterium]|nr:prephenate dehydratase [Mariprofundaceae bacterium]